MVYSAHTVAGGRRRDASSREKEASRFLGSLFLSALSLEGGVVGPKENGPGLLVSAGVCLFNFLLGCRKSEWVDRISRRRMKAFIMAMLPWTARLLRSTLESMATPSWVKA